jgi:hypothetical protein
LGDPSLPPAEELALRCRLLERALEALETNVTGQQVFEVAGV